MFWLMIDRVNTRHIIAIIPASRGTARPRFNIAPIILMFVRVGTITIYDFATKAPAPLTLAIIL
jgi:hypothetical protein